jgi:hypothetical protein
MQAEAPKEYEAEFKSKLVASAEQCSTVLIGTVSCLAALARDGVENATKKAVRSGFGIPPGIHSE